MPCLPLGDFGKEVTELLVAIMVCGDHSEDISVGCSVCDPEEIEGETEDDT
jgi:hypothetical protein